MSENIRHLVEGVVDGSISDTELISWLKTVHSEGISAVSYTHLTLPTKRIV